MDLIPSFSVDHTKIVPGIFISRQDQVGENVITTYDVRVMKPNVEPAIDVAAMHLDIPVRRSRQSGETETVCPAVGNRNFCKAADPPVRPGVSHQGEQAGAAADCHDTFTLHTVIF